METKPNMVIAIAAVGKRTRAIGKSNGLLWELPADLARFKKLTSGHPVIMGRYTFLSLPEEYRPLPNRTNIVVTRNAKVFHFPSVHLVESLEKAIECAQGAPGGEKVFIIGGGKLYDYALRNGLVDRLEITEVDDDALGDVFFPDYSGFTKVISEEPHPKHNPPFVFRTLEREVD